MYFFRTKVPCGRVTQSMNTLRINDRRSKNPYGDVSKRSLRPPRCIMIWRRIEAVITSRTRNAVVRKGTWVRIPPSPPANPLCFKPRGVFYCANLGTNSYVLGTDFCPISATISSSENGDLAVSSCSFLTSLPFLSKQ